MSVTIQNASREGLVDVVKSLLKDSKIDPSANDNDAIQLASVNGHVEVVELLLADERVDPSDRDNWSIKFASQVGHLKVVELLLADERVNPSAGNNAAIQYASLWGHLEIVKLLMKDPRVNPSDQDNLAIKWAQEKSQLKVVRELLKDERVHLYESMFHLDDHYYRNPTLEEVTLDHPDFSDFRQFLLDRGFEYYSHFGLDKIRWIYHSKRFGAVVCLDIFIDNNVLHCTEHREKFKIPQDLNKLKKHIDYKFYLYSRFSPPID